MIRRQYDSLRDGQLYENVIALKDRKRLNKIERLYKID